MRFGAGVILVLLLTGAFALARHNVRSGRGDRRGATRVSLFVLGALIASWVIGARHSLQILEEVDSFLTFLALALLNAGILWLSYVALEPHVRRYCPEILISWTRLLGGRIRDPRVGRDILVGIVAGVVVAFLRLAFYLLPPLIGNLPPSPRAINLEFLLGTRATLSMLFRMVPNALQNGMLVTLVFVVMLMLVKRAWLAAVISARQARRRLSRRSGVPAEAHCHPSMSARSGPVATPLRSSRIARRRPS